MTLCTIPVQKRFDDLSEHVAGSMPTFSNGAVYADLDNDGDLDVVVNNLEDEPLIYQNLHQENAASPSPFLSLNLNGSPNNRNAIGSRLLVYSRDGSIRSEEYYPVRGFMSSAQVPLLLGVRDTTTLDSVCRNVHERTWILA